MGCGKSTAKASAPTVALDAAGPNLLNANHQEEIPKKDVPKEEETPAKEQVSGEATQAATEAAAKADCEQENPPVIEERAATPQGGCWCA
jgi:hypothetical protein